MEDSETDQEVYGDILASTKRGESHQHLQQKMGRGLGELRATESRFVVGRLLLEHQGCRHSGLSSTLPAEEGTDGVKEQTVSGRGFL